MFRPETLSEGDFEALQEIVLTRKHKLGWLLFGIADDIAAGVVIGLTLTIGSCFGIGVAVVVVSSHRGTGVMLASALAPLAAYAALEIPMLSGIVDFGQTKHPHLYPTALSLAVVSFILAYWYILLVYVT